MRFERFLVAVLALSACAGGSGTPAPPSATPTAETAVDKFMRAVADSDVAAMGRVWGTTRGSAATTGQPSDWEKRLTVAQLYLRGAPYKIVSNAPVPGDAARRTVQLELDRGQCQRVVPVVVVKTSAEGWLVNQIDLNAAGTPATPCGAPNKDQ